MQNGLQKESSRIVSAAKANVEDVAGKLSEKAGEAAEIVKEGADAARTQAGHMVEAGKEYAENVKSEVSQALSDAVAAVGDSLAEQVRNRPVMAIGAAVLAGMFIGNLLRK